MSRNPPEYRGTYNRAFLPPVLLIGVGRVGAQVCQDFFDQIRSSFAVRTTDGTTDQKPLALTDLIAAVALVRQMDASSLPLKWASRVFTWDTTFDEDKGSRFQLGLNHGDTAFWAPPTLVFQPDVGSILGTMGPDCAQMMGFVSSDVSRGRRDRLSLPRISELSEVPRLVIAVGSLCEPDVAALIPQLPDWSINSVVHGDAGRVSNIVLLDCGLPDHPEFPHQTWQQCPAAIVAQLLSNLQTVPAISRSISFFLTGGTLGGIEVPVRVRSQIMVGLLKIYLVSTLYRRSADQGRRSVLVDPGSMSMSHRASVYVEVTLKIDNLADLAVRAVLAEWKHRVLAVVGIMRLDEIQNGLSALIAGDWENLVRTVALSCARATIEAGSIWAVDSFRRFVERKRDEILEALQTLTARAAQPPTPAPPESPVLSLWQRILTFFGWRPPVRQPKPSGSAQDLGAMRANLEKTGERYSRLLRCLTQLAPFIAETIRPNSDFSDRTGEADFAHDLNDNVAAIAYRRISLQTCPPEVRRFVEGAVSDVDAIVVTTLLGGNPTLPLLSLVKSQLESRFKQPAANAREADIERQTEGIVVWLNADPELRRFIAEFAVYRLTPLWRFFPQRNANWSGFLSIFEYGARGPDDRSDEATTRALESLATDMKSALLALDPLGTLRSKWSVEEVLEKRDFHLEGWPFYRSIGFLWTEHPTLGRGFGNDFDATQLLGRAVKWRNENPQEAAWVPLAAAVATGDI